MAHAQPGEAAACAEEETGRLAPSQVFQAGVLRTPTTMSPWRPSSCFPGVGAQPLLSPCAVPPCRDGGDTRVAAIRTWAPGGCTHLLPGNPGGHTSKPGSPLPELQGEDG